MRCIVSLIFASYSLAQVLVGLRTAERIQLPGFVDSNSPAVWWQDRLVVFTSDNTPKRSEGPDIFNLVGPEIVEWNGPAKPRWIEAAWADPEDGTIYAWYHHEPSGICPGNKLTAPEIGAAVSFDGGRSFEDFGIILRSADTPDCGFRNAFFAGGHGDFSVAVSGDYFYFVFTTYGGPSYNQGLGLARLAFADRARPVGLVSKYFQGEWKEPGLGGHLTSVLRPSAGWETGRPVAYWGPSVHWNHSFGNYVMLVNRSCCDARWHQEGVYISMNSDLANPDGWSEPVRLLEGGDWYPQVIGLGPGETAAHAGAVSRLFVRGLSSLELVFGQADGDENPETLPPEAIPTGTSAQPGSGVVVRGSSSASSIPPG